MAFFLHRNYKYGAGNVIVRCEIHIKEVFLLRVTYVMMIMIQCVRRIAALAAHADD